MGREIDRRDFLKLTGSGLAGVALLGATAGCGGGRQGGESGSIKIGGLLSFTGPFAPLAESIRNGLNLFFEQNDNRIGERQVEISYEDDEGDPQVALRKYRQLVSRDQVDFVVGPISSSVALALVDLVERDQVVLIDANAAANALSWEKKNDYIYRVSFSNWQNGTAAATYIAENVGKTAYALAPDYPAGTEVLAAFRAAFEKAGGEVIQEIYPPLGNNDYATYLTEIQNADPELVFAFFAGSDATRFVEQYRSFGLKGRIPLAGTAEFGDELVTGPTGAAAEGIVSAVHYSPFRENEVNRRFVEAYREAYERLPNMFSCQGYDSGQVISAAVKEAGGTETEALIEALSDVSFDSPRGSVAIDPKTNNPIQNYYVVRNILEGDRIVLEDLETVEDVTMPAKPPS